MTFSWTRQLPSICVVVAVMAAAVAGCARHDDEKRARAQTGVAKAVGEYRSLQRPERRAKRPVPRRKIAKGTGDAPHASRPAPSSTDQAPPRPAAAPVPLPKTAAPAHVVPSAPAIPSPAPSTPVAAPKAFPPIAPPPQPAQKATPAPARPSTIAPAPATEPDPLPTQPAPAPPRPDPMPAPPNRVNITPPSRSGGGMVATAPRPASPAGLAAAALGAARVEEGRRLLAQGRVLAARSQFESAVEIAPGPALLELGRSYDPYYLGQLTSIDDGSEPRRAAALYQDAILHGAVAAGTDLDRVRAVLPPAR